MTASRGGLLVLTAIAVLLAALIALGGDRPGTPAPGSRRLEPGFAAETVRRLRIERTGEAPIVIELGPGGAGPRLTSPLEALADADAIDELLGAVELLSWRRRGGEAEARRDPRATLAIERDGGPTLELTVGPELAGVDGAWVAVRRSGQDDGAAWLVDAALARALAPGLDALRPRRALRVGDAAAFEIHGPVDAILSGRPMALHLPGGRARARVERVAALRDALEAIRFTRFVEERGPGDAPGPARLTVNVVSDDPGQTLEVFGACPQVADEVSIRAAPGLGCAAAASIAALDAALPPSGEADATALAPWLEPRLVSPGDQVVAMTLAVAGQRVSLRAAGGGWRLDDGAAAAPRLDAAAPAELVAALASEVAPVSPLPPRSSPPPPAAAADAHLATIVIERAGGDPDAITIDRRRRRAHRGVEAADLAVSPALLALLDQVAADGALAFADRTILRVEPTSLSTVRLRDSRDLIVTDLARGELIGEWHVLAPAGRTADAAALAAVAAALAPLRSLRRLARFDGSVAHRLELGFDAPPTGGPAPSYRIDLARASGGAECDAQLTIMTASATRDDAPIAFQLPATTCATLAASLLAPR